MSSARHQDLPVSFRGYDRAATEARLWQLEEQRKEVERQRDDVQRRLEEVTAEVEGHRSRAQAVADALVTAQRIANDLKASAEAELEAERRELSEALQRLEGEGAGIRSEARQEATEIVREARVRADRLIAEVGSALTDYEREADEFLGSSRDRLTALVHELLSRMPGSAPEYASADNEPAAGAETEVAAEDDGDAPAAAVA
jgi:cell division initiation protein